MNEALLRSFLDDISTNPLDPAPRLIFADWLEEQANEDAEYARAALLRLGAHELQAPTPVHALVGSESRTIWNRFRKAWLGPIHQVSGIRAACVGGLIHLEVTVTGWMSRPLRLFAESPGWNWVSSLTVTGWDQRIDRVWQRPWLKTVAKIRIRSNRQFLRGRWGHLFDSEHLEGLRELELPGQINDRNDLTRLAQWPGLARVHSLNLASNAVGVEELEPLLTSPHLHGLRRLDLSSCGLHRQAVLRLVSEPNLQALEELSLSHNDLSGATLAGLASAPLARSLRALHLGHSALGDEGATYLAGCALPALKQLRLSSANVGAPGCLALTQTPWLPRVEVLEANYNPFGPHARAFARAPLTGLRSLALRHAGLNETFANELRDSPHLGRLHALDLHSNQLLGNAIAEAVAQNPTLNELRWLDLGNCGIGNPGALVLARWPGLPKLELLALESNRLSDEGLRALIEAPGRRVSAIWRIFGNLPSRHLRSEVRQHSPTLAL